jgi:xanthine dehydrogenase small subunit
MASARAAFEFTLNGMPVPVREEAPQTTLLDYVRSRGFTGAKEGCAEGECGACAVLLVATDADGRTVYEPVNSCLIPLPAIASREVYTVEALAESGRLAEVQRAMIDYNGSQCGHCTPGFVVSMFAEQFRPERGPADVHALGGNLCRCTGYRPIRDALFSLGPPPEGAFLKRLERPAPKPTAFEYQTAQGRFSRPQSLTGCLRVAADVPDSRFVAGNTDLGVVTNLRGLRCSHLISLESVPELVEFRDGGNEIEIGAGLTLTQIGEYWRNSPEVFREWLPLFASVLIRNRATLGGNLATASPIGDAAPMLLALDAEVRIAALSGERIIPLRDFFRGYRQTSLRHGEILRSVRISKPLPKEARFYKVAKRRMDDISTVAACFSISRDDSGRILSARIAYGGVAAIPLRALEAERILEGTYGEPDDLLRAKASIRGALQPIGDHRGSAEYRLALAQSLLDKFWFEQSSLVTA